MADAFSHGEMIFEAYSYGIENTLSTIYLVGGLKEVKRAEEYLKTRLGSPIEEVFGNDRSKGKQEGI